MITHLFPHTLTVTRDERVSTGKGGFVKSDAESFTVRGRIGGLSGADVTIAGQHQAKVTNSCHYDPAADLRVDDRVSCEGRSFVVRVAGITPSVAVYKKALLEETVHG